MSDSGPKSVDEESPADSPNEAFRESSSRLHASLTEFYDLSNSLISSIASVEGQYLERETSERLFKDHMDLMKAWDSAWKKSHKLCKYASYYMNEKRMFVADDGSMKRFASLSGLTWTVRLEAFLCHMGKIYRDCVKLAPYNTASKFRPGFVETLNQIGIMKEELYAVITNEFS